MSEPRALVEHFFRHELGRLGAVLTRLLGGGKLVSAHLFLDGRESCLVTCRNATRSSTGS
jgi:hypothetical protein